MKYLPICLLSIVGCTLSTNETTIYPKNTVTPNVVSIFGPSGCGEIDINTFKKENGFKFFERKQDEEIEEIMEGVYAPKDMWPENTVTNHMKPIVDSMPLEYNVFIVATGNAPWWGITMWNHEKNRFEIWMNMDGATIFGEIFAHEWAHAATWDVPESSHGSAWAVMYALGYRALIKED